MVMRQMVQQKPVTWAGDQAPITIIGSTNWTNITVSVEVQLEAKTHAMPWVGARIVGRVGDPAPAGPQAAAAAAATAAAAMASGLLDELAAADAPCDDAAFPHATQRQFMGLTQGSASLSTENLCRQACCTIGQQHCTLYQFFSTEPSGSQCWYGLPGHAIVHPIEAAAACEPTATATATTS